MTVKTKKILTAVLTAILCLTLCLTFAACGEETNTGGGGGGGSRPVDEDPYVTAVTVTHAPTKTEYLTGEEFSPRGLRFDATWMIDGKEELIEDMEASDCDSYSPRGRALTLEDKSVTFLIGGFSFDVPILVTEGQPDLPVAYDQLTFRPVVTDSGSTVTNPTAGVLLEESFLYNHVIYSNPTAFTLKGGWNKYLAVRGNDNLTGTKDTGKRVKLHYAFKNMSESRIVFRLYYENGGDIGSTPLLQLNGGEATATEFYVDTSTTAAGSFPYFRIELGCDVSSAVTLAAAGYKVSDVAADDYEVTLVNASFADGGTTGTLAAGASLPSGIDCPTAEGQELMGWYNLVNPGERWITADGGAAFAMPAHDLVLAPIVRTTVYDSKDLNPRVTSGGARPEVHNGNMTQMGEANYSTDGYTTKRVLYTIYGETGAEGAKTPTAAGAKVVSGCGNHMGNDFEYNRLFRFTLTRVSGDVRFRHFVEYNSGEYVQKITTAEVTLDADHTVATFYVVIPRGTMLNNSNNECNFQMDILEDMTGDASFVMTCEYARMI